MAQFKIHDETTAPDASRKTLEGAKKALGFIPSLYGVFAENPAALEAYTTLAGIFDKAGFTPLERQVVLMTANVVNECHFCVAAHTAISKGQNLDMDVIYAIRECRPIEDAKLEALRTFTRKVVIERGFVSDADVQEFIRSGYDQAAVLGVIVGVSLKVMSNYTNHVAETPVNDAFQPFAWSPKEKEASAA